MTFHEIHLREGSQEFHRKNVLIQAGEAANNCAVVCRVDYRNTVKHELNQSLRKDIY